MRFYFSARTRLGLALLFASLASASLFGVGAWRSNTLDYVYMNWNLLLAWAPLLFGLWLVRILKHNLWSSWRALLVSALWLGFLPNSFYMITDFIHLSEFSPDEVVFSTVMLSSFIFTGVSLGYISLYTVHRELLQRMSARVSAVVIGAVLLLSSFAIYLGRELRWNTWDILANPGGILIDVSDRLLHPSQYPEMFAVTYGFFVLLTSLYVVVWFAARVLRNQKSI
ncbi:MAG TPA: DUF1361 domain-containing protein [Candidatus Saccharimonadales bacterium]|nr:DUF1361 domain-containing protein [Candidatus Saccharimonadales bacterium]